MDECPSCGVEYAEHMGLFSMCQELTEAWSEVRRLQNAVSQVTAERDQHQEALERIMSVAECGLNSYEGGVMYEIARKALRGEEE